MAECSTPNCGSLALPCTYNPRSWSESTEGCRPFCPKCALEKNCTYPAQYEWECPNHSRVVFEKVKGVKIACVNVRRTLFIYEGKYKNVKTGKVDLRKIDQISKMLTEYDLDILGFVEADLDSGDNLSQFDVEGYSFYPHNKDQFPTAEHCGGKCVVCIYVKNKTIKTVEKVFRTPHEYFDCAEFSFETECRADIPNLPTNFDLALVYWGSKCKTDHIFKFLHKERSETPLVVLGDFNINFAGWNNKKLEPPASAKIKLDDSYKKLIHVPTRIQVRNGNRSATMIDMILLRNSSAETVSGVIHPMLLKLGNMGEDDPQTMLDHHLIYMAFTNSSNFPPYSVYPKLGVPQCSECASEETKPKQFLTAPCLEPNHNTNKLLDGSGNVVRIGYIRYSGSDDQKSNEYLENLKEKPNVLLSYQKECKFDILIVHGTEFGVATNFYDEFEIKFINGYIICNNRNRINVNCEVAEEAENPVAFLKQNLKGIQFPDSLLFTEMSTKPNGVDLFAWEDEEKMKILLNVKHVLLENGYKPLGLVEVEEVERKEDKNKKEEKTKKKGEKTEKKNNPVIQCHKLFYTMFTNAKDKYSSTGSIKGFIGALPPVTFASRSASEKQRVDIVVSKHNCIIRFGIIDPKSNELQNI